MSFLVIEVLSKGIILAADRNITTTYTDGSEDQSVKRQKVLKWPNDKAIVGYVGQARIGGKYTDEWLTDFINRNLTFSSLSEVSEILRKEVEAQRKIDEGKGNPSPLIIHLGGFETNNSVKIPRVFLITNVWDLKNGQYCDFRKDFKSTEELSKKLPEIKESDYQKSFSIIENKLEPFWFHQGFDLMTFNVMHAFTKNAFKYLINNHPSHKLPTDLQEWEKHIKMQILMYGSYFESFGSSGQQYVGGGVDIVSLSW